MNTQQPWEQEPDRLEFEHAGMKCLVLRMPAWGGLCGYVGLPPGHPAYGLDFDEIDEKRHIDVHGGLTFAENGDGDRWPLGYWWVGFDCAHAGDLVPELYRLSFTQILYNEYRDIDYVAKETKALAEQLVIRGLLPRLCAVLRSPWHRVKRALKEVSKWRLGVR